MSATTDKLLWAQDEFIRCLFASSETFQNEVEAADATEAKQHVIAWGDDGTDYKKARIVVLIDGGLGRHKTGTSNWNSRGHVRAGIWRKQDRFDETNANIEQSYQSFREFYSQVCFDIERILTSRAEVMGMSPFNVTDYFITDGPSFNPTSETTVYDESSPDTPDEYKSKVTWFIELSFDFSG